jgi:hypothetical protein
MRTDLLYERWFPPFSVPFGPGPGPPRGAGRRRRAAPRPRLGRSPGCPLITIKDAKHNNEKVDSRRAPNAG